MRCVLFTTLLTLALARLAQTQSVAEQVNLALRALPEEYRDGASVLICGETDEPNVLRRGTNGWTCVADDPEPGIFVLCYFKTWEPLRTRFHRLVAQGTSHREAWDICEADVKAGRIPPPTPAIGFELVGVGPNGAQPFVLVYMPYATAGTLGLSTEPDNGLCVLRG